MNRLYVLAGLLVGVLTVAGVSVQAVEQDTKFEIDKFMKKAHAKAGSYKANVTTAVKDKNWDAASKDAKEWFKEAQKFTKATPPKGDKAAFEKLATNYCKTVKTLVEATEAKDAKKATAAIGQINKACAGCHKSHK